MCRMILRGRCFRLNNKAASSRRTPKRRWRNPAALCFWNSEGATKGTKIAETPETANEREYNEEISRKTCPPQAETPSHEDGILISGNLTGSNIFVNSVPFRGQLLKQPQKAQKSQKVAKSPIFKAADCSPFACLQLGTCNLQLSTLNLQPLAVSIREIRVIRGN